MFPSAKRKPIPHIDIIAGNTGTYVPMLTFNNEPLVTLTDGLFLMLIVKTPMGETVLSKTLTGTETGIPIVFDFVPTDTIDVVPFKHYHYSIDLYSQDGQTEYHTVERGVFNLIPAIGNFRDIGTNTNEEE